MENKKNLSDKQFEQQLKQKLEGFTREPSPELWQRISNSNQAFKFKGELYNYEATPPAGAFTPISDQVSRNLFRKQLLRFGLAASVLLFISTVNYLYNSRQAEKLNAKKEAEKTLLSQASGTENAQSKAAENSASSNSKSLNNIARSSTLSNAATENTNAAAEHSFTHPDKLATNKPSEKPSSGKASASQQSDNQASVIAIDAEPEYFKPLSRNTVKPSGSRANRAKNSLAKNSLAKNGGLKSAESKNSIAKAILLPPSKADQNLANLISNPKKKGKALSNTLLEEEGNYSSFLADEDAIPDAVKPVTYSDKFSIVDTLDQIKKQQEQVKQKAAKDSVKAKKKQRQDQDAGWYASAYIQPRYTVRRFEPNKADNFLITNLSSSNRVLRSKMGYQAGVRLHRVYKGLELYGNLNVQMVEEDVSMTMKSTKVDSFSVTKLTEDNVMLIAPNYETYKRNVHNKFYYSGASFGFSVNLDEEHNFYAGGGLGANVLISGTTTVTDEGKGTTVYRFPTGKSPLEQVNFSMNAFVGYRKKFTENWSYSVAPTLNYFVFSTMRQNEPLGIKPYMLGINMSIRYKIK